jgi:phosphoglycolate phosphatase-like HAD superfamily hydrolase
MVRGVLIDLFHTLTDVESEWSDLPFTCDVLGIDRRDWDRALTDSSRWRLCGDVRDPRTIVATLARRFDPSVTDMVIDAEVFSCEVGHVKPEPAIFHHALDRIGLPAADCVFVGDGGSNELEGARSVGLRTVFVSGVIAHSWPERIAPRAAVADHHVERVPDLLGLPMFARV